MIGEGANLGVTQRGRIEAAQKGVKLNTDAIDNSAGVNTSDVEVNIKIALARPEREGRLSPADRNSLLAAMTDEVGVLVLRNNYLQTLALSLAERKGVAETGFLTRLMQSLEQRGLLSRAVEFLPDDAALAERTRRGQALTRPELAVLLAYAKLTLYDDLLVTSVPDDPYLARELSQYFPREVQEQFPDAVELHRLRREIIATSLANAVINRGGPACIVRLIDETDADISTIVMAYVAVDAMLRAEAAQRRDRRARQPASTGSCSSASTRRPGSPALPHGLVRAQCRFQGRPRGRRSPVSARLSARSPPASTPPCRRTCRPRAASGGRTSPMPASRPASPANSPISTPWSRRRIS